MKNAIIIGRLDERNNLINFYAEDRQESVYIFSRKYKKCLFNYFRNGVSVRHLFSFTKTHHNDIIIKIMMQLRTHIRFIEKEYGVEILVKRGENRKQKNYRMSDMTWEQLEIA